MCIFSFISIIYYYYYYYYFYYFSLCSTSIRLTTTQGVVPQNLPMANNSNPLGMKLSCDECDLKFDSKEQLIIHVSIEHKNVYSCQLCEQVFAYPSQLKHHQTKHNNNRPFICGECGVNFMKVSLLCLSIHPPRHLSWFIHLFIPIIHPSIHPPGAPFEGTHVHSHWTQAIRVQGMVTSTTTTLNFITLTNNHSTLHHLHQQPHHLSPSTTTTPRCVAGLSIRKPTCAGTHSSTTPSRSTLATCVDACSRRCRSSRRISSPTVTSSPSSAKCAVSASCFLVYIPAALAAATSSAVG